jgi:HEPN domain-containing protein
MAERSGDWIKQAERDLESAKSQTREQFHEWACFISQQAAEKACKAVLQSWGAEAWGHSISSLIKGMATRIEVPNDIQNAGRNLDRYYIPSRYPNGFDSGTPADYFTEEDAEHAITDSERILRFCKDLLAR